MKIALMVIMALSMIIFVTYIAVAVYVINGKQNETSQLLRDKGFEVKLILKDIDWKIPFTQTSSFSFKIVDKSVSDYKWDIVTFSKSENKYYVERHMGKTEKLSIPVIMPLNEIEIRK